MSLMLALGMMTSAAAVDAPAGGVIVITGAREGYGVDDIGSATRTDTPLIDVPQAITVVTETEIKDRNLRSMADIMRTVPGAVAAQGEGHRDQIVLRGQNTTADFFIDGQRDDVQYYRPLYNVARVEVLRGPNALIFGRGGGGGVVNRVTKQPLFERRLGGSAGTDSFGAFAVDADLNSPLTGTLAARLNAIYERFDTHRDRYEGRAVAVNPTLRYVPSDRTGVTASYEYVDDDRVVDRGVPSQGDRPLAGARDRFFGGDTNRLGLGAHIGRVAAEHRFTDEVSVVSRWLYGNYDKFYRNILPASAVVDGTVALSGYQDTTTRENLFSQTDLVAQATTGPLDHMVLAAFEIGWQRSTSGRLNAVFGTVRTVRVAATDPLVVPAFQYLGGVGERSSATAAHGVAFTLQDQITFGPVELLLGVRHDRFTLDATDRLSGERLTRTDRFWSPRVGLVVKPVKRGSLYASFAGSVLPQSGDQFTSLNLTAAALKPERFSNYEVGAKWQPLGDLTLAAAVYRLDRTNTRAPGPVAGQTVLTGRQRSEGVELEAAGSPIPGLRLSAGYAYTDARIVDGTSAAPAGTRVPLVPRHQLSVWGRGEVTERLGVGLGVVASTRRFAAVSNTVELPGYSRLDAAVFYRLTDRLDLQANVENLTDAGYFPTAHNDNNISTGAPINGRVTLRVRY